MAYEPDPGALFGAASPFDPSPIEAQQIVAQTLRRNPALAMPTSGVPQRRPTQQPQTMQQPAMPDQPMQPSGPAVPQSSDMLRQLVERMHQRPDTSAYEQQARERGGRSDRDLMVALTLGSKGGQSFHPLSQALLARSMRDSGDYEIPGGWGTVSRTGEVIWNPAKVNENELSRLTKLYEITASDETKRELARQRSEDKAQARADRLSLAGVAAGGRADRAAERAAEKAEADRSRRTDAVRREYNTRLDKVRQGSYFADDVVRQLAVGGVERNAQAQVAAIMQFGKMLDPDSVVREAEQRMIAEARGFADSLMQLIPRLQTGALLTPTQIQQMRQIAAQYQGGYGQRVQDLNEFYAGFADRNQLPVQDIVQGYRPRAAGGQGGGASQGRGTADSPIRVQPRAGGAGGGGSQVIDVTY